MFSNILLLSLLGMVKDLDIVMFQHLEVMVFIDRVKPFLSRLLKKEWVKTFWISNLFLNFLLRHRLPNLFMALSQN